MPHKATVTGKTGPAVQATALVLNAISSINLDLDRKVMSIFTGNTMTQELDLSGVTTVTVSISSGNYTVAVS